MKALPMNIIHSNFACMLIIYIAYKNTHQYSDFFIPRGHTPSFSYMSLEATIQCALEN